jgi:hypothetical protein
VLFSHKAGVCIVAGFVFTFLGIFDVSDFKSLTLRSPLAWLPFAVGVGCLVVGIFLYVVFERPAKGPVEEFTVFYEARTACLSPPDLLFLAVAAFYTYAATHGEHVARLKPEWRDDQGHWNRRSTFMEKLGLLQRNSSDEFVRTRLGTAIVYLARKDKRFADVATAVRSDGQLAGEWAY